MGVVLCDGHLRPHLHSEPPEGNPPEKKRRRGRPPKKRVEELQLR